VEPITVTGADWAEYRAPATCLGLTDFTAVQIPAVIGTEQAGTVAIADVRFEPSAGEQDCAE
jgi:beta-glucosidase